MISAPWQILLICLVFLGSFIAQSSAQNGPPPKITAQPSGISVSIGGIAVLTAKSQRGTSWQWLFNGAPVTNSIAVPLNLTLLGTTTSTLTLVGVDASSAGSYSLKVSNLGGTLISDSAKVTVLGTVVSNLVSNVVNIVGTGTGMIASGFKIQLTAPVGSNVVIQASSDMTGWSSLSTNTVSSSGSVSFTDTAATNLPCRFYRARIQ